jgi:hypothetical protein
MRRGYHYNFSRELFFYGWEILNENKDPLTVLKAFSEFSKRQENVFLYFIFKENLLLEKLKKFVADQKLDQQVFFIGKLNSKN